MSHIRRRDLLIATSACMTGLTRMGNAQPTTQPDAPVKAHSPRFTLSQQGSSRATAYAETNKIVTIGNKTHVAWLDSVDKKFIPRVRTLDRTTGQWSKTVTIGQAADNHGGPALTCDSKGYLHIVYHPHHNPFHYRRSVRPNDASEWIDPFISFGQKCTYPTLLCAPDDTLYLTCREHSMQHWTAGLYAKPANGEWEFQRTVLRSMNTGYSHFQEALAWGPDRKTMHMSIRFYDSGRGHTVGYIRSSDFGKTWQRSDGKTITLPVTAETATNIVNKRDHKKPNLRCGSIAVDPKGLPWVLYSTQADTEDNLNGIMLASQDSAGQWHSRPIDEIQKRWPGWHSTMPGGITWTRDRTLVGVATIIKSEETDVVKLWGHPGSEIVRFISKDRGKSFYVQLISKPDNAVPHWLPNIERPTGHHDVDSPGVIYSAGTRGKDNSEIVANGVIWCRPA